MQPYLANKVPWVCLEERAPKLELGERAEHESAHHDHEGREEAGDGEVAVNLRAELPGCGTTNREEKVP